METGARLLLGFILFHFFVNKVYDSHKLCEQSFGLKEKKKKKKKETREKKTFWKQNPCSEMKRLSKVGRDRRSKVWTRSL